MYENCNFDLGMLKWRPQPYENMICRWVLFCFSQIDFMYPHVIMAVWWSCTWQELFDTVPFGENTTRFGFLESRCKRYKVGVPVESRRGVPDFKVPTLVQLTTLHNI